MSQDNNESQAVLPGALRDAMAEFVDEIKNTHTQISKRLDQQESRMNRFDLKMMRSNRLPISAQAEAEAPHQKAFSAYIRRGDENGLRGLPDERKGLTIASDGGFLAAPQIADMVQSTLYANASLRQLANVVTIEGASYEVLIDKGQMTAGWVTETSAPETESASVSRITIPLYELSAMPKATQRLLDDAAFDVEGWLALKISEQFARSEATAFITGDGINKPKGILNYPILEGDISKLEGTIYCVRTFQKGGFKSPAGEANKLLEMIYALGSQYRANAHFVMNSKTAAFIRQAKDAEGRFLWLDPMGGQQTPQLLGYPVLLCEDMPDMADAATPIVFGDFRAAYTVVERADLRILRDPFSAKPHVLFYATKRVGGGVVDFKAFNILKLA